MKGIFRRNGTTSNSTSSASSSSSSTTGRGAFASRLAAALGPQYSVPPFPHPLPSRYLALHCTPHGLLILPISHSPSASRYEAPRTTEDERVEDVAHDKVLSSLQGKQGNAGVDASATGARLEWGRDGAVRCTSEAEGRRPRAVRTDGDEISIHCYGVIGIIRIFSGAYLLVITSRTLVGDYLRPKQPVYRCTGVLAIPLTLEGAKSTMQGEAKRQLQGYQGSEQKGDTRSSASSSEEESDDEVQTPSVIPKDAFDGNPMDAAILGSATLRPNKSKPWLSKQARSASESRLAGQKGRDPSESAFVPQGEQQSVDIPDAATETSAAVTLTADEMWHEATKAELEDKVVKETARQYSRGEMWFTYDFDLTTPLQCKQAGLEEMSKSKARPATNLSSTVLDPNTEPWATLPLWRRVDRRFWHNEHLSRDFVEAGLHGLVLPLMQGYVQITPLPIESLSPPMRALDLAGDAMDAVSEVVSHSRLEAQLLIISRRSKERAGLRYQRRGVNGQGQAANYVESEQILFIRRGGSECHVMSFVQFRGSIPLYWKQDPFSMKPPPVLEGSPEDNRKAFAKHFNSQLSRYGKVICINLAEQHGKEGAITKAYGDAVEQLSDPNVIYKAFDFHEECKGMRFERVGKLIDELKESELKQMDCFWKCVSVDEGENVYSKQSSAFRVSCLDCLDRTNVVQSAFARYMLGVQLERLGVRLGSVKGERDEAFDFAFNDSWANNGDMISQIYAGTRALKGDFTRTGKRNLIGMMNDATNSVYRMVQGAVTDFFKQTVVDFQYGYSSLATLERYNDNLAAPDPSQSNRLARARMHAIETTAREVITKEEKLLAGWTLFSPIEPNRIETPKLEEKVVLLTNKALYSCGYDFTAEKVAEFSKIKLGDIIGIKRGVYILSPNEGYNPENHWGLVVSYVNEERRLNTASMRSKPNDDALSPGAVNFVAFRAVVDDATVAALQGLDGSIKAAPQFAAAQYRSKQAQSGTSSLTSHDVVDAIVADVVEQCTNAGSCDEDDVESFVKEETIQSLAQAKANASLFAPLIEGIKRRVWL